jgi:hypothetical protein
MKTGRETEAKLIRQANKAAAVGRLMLGEMSGWDEFLDADSLDLASLPRRQLKSGAADAKKRMSPEIRRFCSINFENMTEAKLSKLYEVIKAHRGIEFPLKEFEQEYSKVLPRVIAGFPPHCTIVFSLWGLQIKFPEDILSKDIYEAINTSHKADAERLNYRQDRAKKDLFAKLERKRDHAARSCILSCFNLVEAYLNGIAWDFAQDEDVFASLSKRQQKLISDSGHVNLRDKILKYPAIVSGRPLWDESNDTVAAFLDVFKPFRDSLVHPSPFSAPEKFGGYDKLKKLYLFNFVQAHIGVKITADLIVQIHRHINGIRDGYPVWLDDIIKFLEETVVEKK